MSEHDDTIDRTAVIGMRTVFWTWMIIIAGGLALTFTIAIGGR